MKPKYYTICYNKDDLDRFLVKIWDDTDKVVDAFKGRTEKESREWINKNYPDHKEYGFD